MSRHRFGMVAFGAILVACTSHGPSGAQPPDRATLEAPTPPIARRVPHQVKSPHGTRSDPYYWLRDDTRQDPEVLEYLSAENAYTAAILADVSALQKRLFDEMVGRIKQDDSTVPVRHRGYWYYTRYEEGMEHPIHARRKGRVDAPEQILLDGNELARGTSYFSLGDFEVSPGETLLAHGQDTVGRRRYEILFRDLETDELLPDRLADTTSDLVWAADSRSILYVEKDPITLLGVRVRRHDLGTDPADDPVVYEEPDHSFYLSIHLSRDERYIIIRSSSTVSDETRFIRRDRPATTPTVLLPRARDFEYDADHLGKQWVIRTNLDARNFRIVTLADDKAGNRDALQELVPHDESVLIEDIALFDDYLVVAQRSDALRRLQIRPWGRGEIRFVEANEPVYTMWLDDNREPATHWLRYGYSSLRTPDTIYEMNMATGERRKLKQDEIPGGFRVDDYVIWRDYATVRDGSRVPISLMRHKDVGADERSPLYQYGYGAYGASMDPSFRSSILSLVDRGFVFAIAHVRGGQELGRNWYEDGKLLNKKNTFHDFIDVTAHLAADPRIDSEKMVAVGGSAGGLLVGAVVNMAPERYAAAVAHVPFVDVVTTMLDETIPLTSNEFDEWGNPAEKAAHDYMLSYSPYDNVTAEDYPALFVTTGLWDSQVQYFEPAKWVARLRAHKTDDNVLLLHTNMEAGHGGASGRFERQHERAREYAFILRELGQTHAPTR